MNSGTERRRALPEAQHGLVFEVRSAAIWIQMRLGVQAALCARPEDLEACNPKTELGKVVRGLVMEAGKGRSTALKTLLRFLEYVEDQEIAAAQRMMPDIAWDWSMDGVWLTKADFSAESEEAAAAATPQGARVMAKSEVPPTRQQRRYLARIAEKEAARNAPPPLAA